MVVSVLERPRRTDFDALPRIAQCLKILGEHHDLAAEDLQMLIDCPGAREVLMRKWKAMTKVSKREPKFSDSYDYAIAFMRSKMIPPEAAEMCFGAEFDKRNYPYEHVPFESERLRTHNGDHMLVPVLPITARDVQSVFTPHNALCWWDDLPAYDQTRLEQRWLLMSMGVLPATTGASHAEQQKLFPRDARIASLAEVFYGVGLRYLAYGEDLLGGARVRICDCNEEAIWYYVEFSPVDGFSVGFGGSKSGSDRVGVMTVIDPQSDK